MSDVEVANEYEAAARERKATTLAIEAHAQRIPADLLREIDTAGWRALCGLAGTKMPSETTKARVIEIVQAMDAKPQPVPDDPFAGLPA